MQINNKQLQDYTPISQKQMSFVEWLRFVTIKAIADRKTKRYIPTLNEAGKFIYIEYEG